MDTSVTLKIVYNAMNPVKLALGQVCKPVIAAGTTLHYKRTGPAPVIRAFSLHLIHGLVIPAQQSVKNVLARLAMTA